MNKDFIHLHAVSYTHLDVYKRQAMYLRDICKNDYMEQSDVKEGKIELSATIDGLLKVDVEKLRQVNALGEMMIATSCLLYTSRCV